VRPDCVQALQTFLHGVPLAEKALAA